MNQDFEYLKKEIEKSQIVPLLLLFVAMSISVVVIILIPPKMNRINAGLREVNQSTNSWLKQNKQIKIEQESSMPSSEIVSN